MWVIVSMTDESTLGAEDGQRVVEEVAGALEGEGVGRGQELLVLVDAVLDDEDCRQVLVDVGVVGGGEDRADLRRGGAAPAEVLVAVEHALVRPQHRFQVVRAQEALGRLSAEDERSAPGLVERPDVLDVAVFPVDGVGPHEVAFYSTTWRPVDRSRPPG